MFNEKNLNSIQKKLESVIYLDYPATTQCDPIVLEKMLPYFSKIFGNPNSKNHLYGWVAEEALKNSREKIAEFLNVYPDEIYFTSGATEANVAILNGVLNKSLLEFRKNSSEIPHLITQKTEHKSILETAKFLKKKFEVTILDVDEFGKINLEELTQSIKKNTKLISIMCVNNEIGVVSEIKKILEICKEKNILFHSDMVQALGKIKIDLNELNVDFASFSSHKIYGPKGVGCMFIRNGKRFPPLITGGGQEKNMRSGTVPVPLCVGFASAIEMFINLFDSEFLRITELSEFLISKVIKEIPLAKINGTKFNCEINELIKESTKGILNTKNEIFENNLKENILPDVSKKVPHINNFSIPYVEGESIIMMLENFAISTGSACTSDNLVGSHVLSAMNINEIELQSAIRVGIGRSTTKNEILAFVEKLKIAIEKLRNMSPLWEMYKNGEDISKIDWGNGKH